MSRCIVTTLACNYVDHQDVSALKASRVIRGVRASSGGLAGAYEVADYDSVSLSVNVSASASLRVSVCVGFSVRVRGSASVSVNVRVGAKC